jgi:DNA-binding NarL/FixJ family response regulator
MEDMLDGKGVKDIAQRLGVQPTTVATFKSRLFEKLGVTNLLDLQRLVALHRQMEP